MVEYRDIPGFSGYRVGDDGSVQSCLRIGAKGIGPRLGTEWRTLKTARQTSGHLFVGLYRGRGHKPWLARVHRLVMLAFVGPCPSGMEVRHLDGDPTNNRLANLKYGTRLENATDADRHGVRARGSRHGNSKLTSDKVLAIRRDHDAGMTCDDMAAKHACLAERAI